MYPMGEGVSVCTFVLYTLFSIYEIKNEHKCVVTSLIEGQHLLSFLLNGLILVTYSINRRQNT